MNTRLKVVLGSIVFATVACQTAPEKPENTAPRYFGFNPENLDSSVHACENFFQFTAGGWLQNNPIPDTEARWGQFNMLAERNKEAIRGLLDSLVAIPNLKKGSQAQLVGDLYYSGTDSIAREAAGVSPLLPYLNRVGAITTHSELLPFFAEMKFMGASTPFYVSVSPDRKNSNANALYIGQSGLGMPDRDYYLKSDSASAVIQEKYRTYMASLFELAGDVPEAASAKAEKIYALENRLAEEQMSRTLQRQPENTYNPYSVARFNQEVFDLTPYLSVLKLRTEDLIVTQPDYLKALSSILTETPIESWKDYLSFRFLSAHASKLSLAFEQADFDFNSKTLRGNKEMNPRWKRVQDAMGGLNEQIGYVYVDRYFPESSKQKISEMVENIRAVYRERIQDLDWMGEETKEKAIAKLNAFNYKIGYPDTWKDYSNLTISRASYFDNMMALGAYKTSENLSKFGKPVDKSEWFMGAHIVNAYYSPSYNEIVFPAGILQHPFFDPEADDALNYGAIGGVIGHEFTHGFDDQGSKYDANGNLENWWTTEDRSRFDALAGEIVAQYSAYEPLPGMNVNGELTLGENIADVGGLTLAYHAYVKSREGQPEVAPIDGFTDRQRVFLGWAQVWQSQATDEYLRNMVVTDPHSPPQYRVNGPTINIPEFYENFGCEAPKKTIAIW